MSQCWKNKKLVFCEVMALALQITGAWKGRFQWGLQPLHIEPEQLKSPDCAGAVVNIQAKHHWVAVRYFENELWLLDSQKEPELLSPAQYRLYIKRHRDAFPVFRVKDGEEDETCSTAVGADTLATDTLASTVDGSLAIDTPLLPCSGGDVAIKRRSTGEGDAAMLDLTAQDDCVVAALAVARHWPDDAQEMIFAACSPFHV